MSEATKFNKVQIIHSVIGLVLMFGIQLLPPIEPITKIGMQIGGIFIGAIYLWSTVGLFWPSLITIIALAFTDYTDMYGMFGAFSGYLPLLMLFCMIFFGAIGDCGLTNYIARWFLTRKIINGRPTVFIFMIMTAVYAVSAFVDPLMAMLVIWPAMYLMLEEMGYKKEDKYYKIMIIATFLAITLGQCTLPFFGGQLVILGAFETASGYATNYGMYIIFNMVLSIITIIVVALFIKFVLRPDLSKMKNISVENFNKNPLPPMSLQQKIYIVATIAFLCAALAPSILPGEWLIVEILNKLNLVGFTMLALVVLCLIHVDGEPVLDYKRICRDYVMWDLYLLVVVAVFFSGCLLDDSTGIKDGIVLLLNPIFGGHGSVFFIIIISIVGVILTNIANNAIIGAIMMQILIAMAPGLGIDNTMPIAMVITQIMFLAMLTPAASPYAAVLFANEHVTTADIFKYGSIFIVVALIIFLLAGIPIANILF